MSDEVALPDQSASGKLSPDDLAEGWRVDVAPGWRGLEMAPTWLATLLTKDARGRWRGRSMPVFNDKGPIDAISDLLSLLDLGELESCS